MSIDFESLFGENGRPPARPVPRPGRLGYLLLILLALALGFSDSRLSGAAPRLRRLFLRSPRRSRSPPSVPEFGRGPAGSRPTRGTPGREPDEPSLP